jgi:UrcA family protein
MNTNVQTLNKAFLAHAVTALLACVLVVSKASAGEQVRSETVKFHDLNISTPVGAEALYNRIHAAAKRVCADPVGFQPAVIACVRKSEAAAVGKVDQPLLTAYYRTKTGDRTGPLTASR